MNLKMDGIGNGTLPEMAKSDFNLTLLVNSNSIGDVIDRFNELLTRKRDLMCLIMLMTSINIIFCILFFYK